MPRQARPRTNSASHSLSEQVAPGDQLRPPAHCDHHRGPGYSGARSLARSVAHPHAPAAGIPEMPRRSRSGLVRRVQPESSSLDQADRVHLGLDRREPRVDVGRSGNGHSIAPFWLYIRVAHHAEMYSSGVNPSVAARSAISRVRLLAAPVCRPPVLGRPFGLGTYLSRF